MTAAQRLSIRTALGRDVAKLAEEIQRDLDKSGTCAASKWREFLQALHRSAGDEVMGSRVGQALQLAILGRIQQGDQNGNANLRSPGGGFPPKRQW